MKRSIFILTLLLMQFATTYAQHAGPNSDGLTWHTDLMEAHQLSQSAHKPIFAFFTGSDWCGWCHKLQRDVFSKPEFIKWAKEKVVLLELDFPRQKQLPEPLKAQNQSLQQAFQVQGYPTIWMFYMAQDSATRMIINPLGSQGYPAGSEQGKEQIKFLNEANAILAKDTSKKK
jgi:thioredoxin-related protein